MNQSPIKLIVLDVDGTLIREQTLCQIIAKNIGKLDRMNWFE
jgi:phosphoserine phosphatase